MKEHHNNHHGNGHRKGSAHTEHINILDQLGSSIKDDVKRGLSLIDASVNQLAQAKWILINIEKTLEGSYTDCPACHEHKNKSVTSSLNSPVKSKHSDNVVIKKEEKSPMDIAKKESKEKEESPSSSKPGPKSKTKTKTKVKSKSPSPVRNVTPPNTKPHQHPCNYDREKAMTPKKTAEKDKPLVKLSDISNVIKGRRRVHLGDFPSLQGVKKKNRKVSVISVSPDEGSDSDTGTYTNSKKRKPFKPHEGSDSESGTYATSKKRKPPKPHEGSDSESGTYANSKKRKPLKPHTHKAPNKKFKSKEIIESDDDSSSEEEKVSVSISEMLKKKKHKHKHDKHDKHDRHDKHHKHADKHHHSKSKVKEIGGKPSFFDRITLAKSDVTDKTDKSDCVRPSKSEKHSSKESDSKSTLEKVTLARSDVTDKSDSSSKHSKPDKEDPVTEKTVEKANIENAPRKEEKEKIDIKAMLLSKAKPDLIKQRLLEKFKQFTEARKVVSEIKEKENSGEAEEMAAIGLKVEIHSVKEKNKETLENNILNSIQTPMGLQDMIEQDELNEKRGNSLDSVDEFIQSVLHNNNEKVTEKEILRSLKEIYALDEENKSIELKAETQIKIKEVIGQFQTVIVAHLQGGGSDSAGNKAGSGNEGSPNSEGASSVEGAQGSTGGNTITNNEQGNIVILNDSQLPSGELTIGNYFLIGREGYPLQLMKYVGGNNFEPLQMSNFTPQQLSVMKNSLL